MTTTEMAVEARTGEETPSRKERRRAAKAMAKAQRKADKAAKKAWKRARPRKTPWITPMIWVSDARAHAEWCSRAFGFEVAENPDESDKPEGATKVVALKHRRGQIFIGQTKTSELGPPGEGGKSSGTLYVYVANVDELAARAQASGAKLLAQPNDEPWGDRCVPLVDPQGHSWMFATHRGCAAECDQDGGDEPEARHAKA